MGDSVIVHRFGGYYADSVAAVIGDFAELEMGGTVHVADLREFTDPAAQVAMQETLLSRRSEEIERALLVFENDPSDENRDRLSFLSSQLLHQTTLAAEAPAV